MSLPVRVRSSLVALLCALLAAPLALSSPAPADAAATRSLRVQVLSTRADLVSAGDVLVAVRLPRGVGARRVHVYVGRREVTHAFRVRRNGRYEGLVRHLRPGSHVLRATAPGVDGVSGDRQRIIDHPNGGPVFTGPQVRPWVCQASAVDDQCNQPATYTFQYRSASTGQFEDYDPQHPPPAADVATTTTDQGHTVPFIIRHETGYQDRDQYRITVLYHPGRAWHAWAPQRQWNHKLLITHGASCGVDHQAGSAPSTTTDGSDTGSSPTTALGRGFAVLSTALDNAGHDCNLATQAESLVMAKERLVERYGALRYTIGTGCSGGSLTQQQVANAYPGIYQGIIPQCSFPDAWSTGQQLVDYHLVRAYVEHPDRWAPGVAWDPASIAAVEGHPNHVNSVILDSIYWSALGDPDSGCAGVTDQQLYDAHSNPDGVRCTLHDYSINELGPRLQKVWTPQEQQIGHGFAGLPLDNVGVQYGLTAMQRGLITPAQFVDLNAKIGGGTIDTEPQPQRFTADEPALLNSYRSGGVNETNNLDGVAIIDLRGPDPGAFHDAYRSFAIRARLEREHGGYRNHVLWYGQAPLIGDPDYTRQALLAMDRWLSAVERDHADHRLARKIVADRPNDLQDRCSALDGVDQVQVPGVGTVCTLPAVQTRFGTPRTVAGEGVETDIQKCTLAPLRRSDYYPTTFTEAQWSRLREAFPSGVCDFSRPGRHQVDTRAWRSYQHLDGSVVYGGRDLGRAPGRSGRAWTSGSFAGWRSGH